MKFIKFGKKSKFSNLFMIVILPALWVDATLRDASAVEMGCRVLDATLLVQVNDGYVDLFCNWLWHARAAGAANAVWVLAYGNETAAAVRGVSEHDARVHVLTTHAAPGTHGFNSAAFNAIAADKIALLRRGIAETRGAVAFSDIDTAWRRNPLAVAFAADGAGGEAPTVLRPLRRGVAAVLETDGRYNLSYFCTCFVVACADATSDRLLARWEAALTPRLGNEQEALNQLLFGAGWRSGLAPPNGAALEAAEAMGVRPLPIRLFPSGAGGGVGVTERSAVRAHHAVLHADFVKGHHAKRQRLKDLGVWHPSCAAFAANTSTAAAAPSAPASSSSSSHHQHHHGTRRTPAALTLSGKVAAIRALVAGLPKGLLPLSLPGAPIGAPPAQAPAQAAATIATATIATGSAVQAIAQGWSLLGERPPPGATSLHLRADALLVRLRARQPGQQGGQQGGTSRGAS